MKKNREKTIEEQLKTFEDLGTYNEGQLMQIKLGLESSVDVWKYADEKNGSETMKRVRQELENQKKSIMQTSVKVRYAFGKKIFIIVLLVLGCFLINSDYQNRKQRREEELKEKVEDTVEVFDFFYTPHLDRIIDSYDLKWSSKSGYSYDMKMENDFVTFNVRKGSSEGRIKLATIEVFLPYPSFSKPPKDGINEVRDIPNSMTQFERAAELIVNPASRKSNVWYDSYNPFDLELVLDVAEEEGNSVFVSFRYVELDPDDTADLTGDGVGIAVKKSTYHYRVMPNGYVMYYSESPFAEIKAGEWTSDHIREFF